MSASLKTTRVTTSGSASEICASACNSPMSLSIERARGVVVIQSRSERMPAPVLVDEILRRLLAQGAEPLRTVGSHPDEITSRDRIPRIAEAIDAAAFEHQQPVFH